MGPEGPTEHLTCPRPEFLQTPTTAFCFACALNSASYFHMQETVRVLDGNWVVDEWLASSCVMLAPALQFAVTRLTTARALLGRRCLSAGMARYGTPKVAQKSTQFMKVCASKPACQLAVAQALDGPSYNRLSLQLRQAPKARALGMHRSSGSDPGHGPGVSSNNQSTWFTKAMVINSQQARA
jgi:hypothetical protein